MLWSMSKLKITKMKDNTLIHGINQRAADSIRILFGMDRKKERAIE